MQDEFLKRLAEDTVLYVRTVCNTIIMEVPKAIVHCQVWPLFFCGAADTVSSTNTQRKLQCGPVLLPALITHVSSNADILNIGLCCSKAVIMQLKLFKCTVMHVCLQHHDI